MFCVKLDRSNAVKVIGILLALSVGFLVSHASHTLAVLTERATASGLAANSPRNTRARPQIAEAVRDLPLSFEANRGQSDSAVDFIARGPGYTVFLRPSEAVLTLYRAARSNASLASETERATVLSLRLVGASGETRGAGLDELPGLVSYFRGNDPARWRAHIPTYSKVSYAEIYPGTDLVYHGNQRRLEYDFVLHPGADPDRIVLAVDGAVRTEVDPAGDLVLHMADRSLRHRKPTIYQDIDGIRRKITGGYLLRGTDEVGFRVGTYDKSRPLVIDPVLSYSTYLGGTGNDDGGGVAIDADGNAYVTGRTSSPDFPTTVGAVQSTLSGATDAFVTKLDPTGAVVYSTYLGGAGGEEVRSIAVDGAGNAYVIGDTTSADFPTTLGAFRTTAAGLLDGFVSKLDATGSALVYSTYVGGAGDEETRGIAIDSAGSAYVVGDTTSPDFPTTPGALQRTFAGTADAFVTKLDSAGATLIYSTYVGGAGTENGLGIAVDAAGNAYVTGDTASANFPTTAGAFRATLAGPTDAFVTKLNSTGSALVYSTYLGGTRDDRSFAIALDTQTDPNAYVAGRTTSMNFPTTTGAFQSALAGLTDAVIAKLNATGSALVYSTYVGGARDDVARGLAVDTSGNAYVIGQTASSNLPVTAGAIQATLAGTQDAFVSKLNTTGSSLIFSTYLGGIGTENGRSITVDTAGSAYVTGITTSADFPTTTGSFDPTFNGLEDVFSAKIADFGQPATLALAPKTASGAVDTQYCVTATVMDVAGRAVWNVTVRFFVTGAHSASGSGRTDASGRITFCYTATTAGDDMIAAFADTNNNSAQNPGEPGDTATKSWVVP
jgi:Bacterial Ig-like domain (group 1)/Beta-propeller repeat